RTACSAVCRHAVVKCSSVVEAVAADGSKQLLSSSGNTNASRKYLGKGKIVHGVSCSGEDYKSSLSAGGCLEIHNLKLLAGSSALSLQEFGVAYDRLRTLQLRRVEVRDADLHLLSLAPFSATLQVMHLHKCSGFTTRGLLPISRSCRSLKVLSLEDSAVIDAGGEWLHALAQNNSVLESLNFVVVGLDSASVEDLALLVGNCKSLVSLKVSGYNTLWVPGVDHAGIATQVYKWKEQSGGTICNQFRHTGMSLDWSRKVYSSAECSLSISRSF
ncbi:unnamed protein product, partial [Sphagnum jensenii]